MGRQIDAIGLDATDIGIEIQDVAEVRQHEDVCAPQILRSQAVDESGRMARDSLESVTDPVGPDFMAPPAREAGPRSVVSLRS